LDKNTNTEERRNKLQHDGMRAVFCGFNKRGFIVLDLETKKVIDGIHTAEFSDGEFWSSKELQTYGLSRIDDTEEFHVQDPDYIEQDLLPEAAKEMTSSEAISSRTRSKEKDCDQNVELDENQLSFEDIKSEVTPNDDEIECDLDTSSDEMIAKLLQNNYLINMQSCMLGVEVELTQSQVNSHAGWSQAQKDELQSLEQMQTWSLVRKDTAHKNILTSKWVYTEKYKMGKLERLKARCVIRGFEQDVLKKNTYSPVANPESFRIFVSRCVKRGYEITQADISTAFLLGDLPSDQVEYMEIPDGCRTELSREEWCLKLNKSLYGLKQSAQI
jgi:hypothetical protein